MIRRGPPEKKTCLQCGKAFMDITRCAKMCSFACSDARHMETQRAAYQRRALKKLHPAFCVWCGLSYETPFPQALYCGPECKEDRRDAKEKGQTIERHAAAQAARQRAEAAKVATWETIRAAFGPTFDHLEKAEAA